MASRAAEIRTRPPDDTAEELEWQDFWDHVIGPGGQVPWKQNQHFGLVGPTEQGKTNLAYHLLSMRSYVAYFAIKTQDETLDRFAAAGGYVRVQDWPPVRGWPKRPVRPEDMPRRLVWPDATQLDSEPEQMRVFGKALRDIYSAGGWCPVFDDYWYLAHILGFEKQTKKFLANARSNYIPMMVCAQRPAGNRLVELFDQATHLCFFRDNDEPNLRRIGGVGWLSSDLIRGHVANLEPFQFLYVNTRNGWMFRCRAPELT